MSYRLEIEPEDMQRERAEPPRRRWVAVVAVVALVMVGSAAGLWAAFRVISHHGPAGTVPVIVADERPVKVTPANPGGLEVPDQDMYILNHQAPADSKVEQLLPPPETPLPRPIPAEPAVAAAPPAAAVAPPAPAAASAAPPAAEPAPAAASDVPAAVAAPAAVTAAPAPAAAQVAVAVPPPAAVPPLLPAAAGAAGYRLQVGAVRSPEAAQQEWTRLKHAQPDILGGLAADARRVDLGERGVFYRIEAGPVADAGAAAQACDELKRRKVGCILVKP